MINAAGPARTVHNRALQYVFQSVAPYSAYGAGVVQFAEEAGCKNLFILARDDAASVEMAEGTKITPQVYPASTVDFALLVAKARVAGTEAWIAFGEAQDNSAMVISLKRQGYAPPLFFASAATQPRFRTLVGQDAERKFGLLRYDARFASPANAKFVAAFAARWGARPAFAGAEAYAAATVLAEAVRRAGTLDQRRLRVELATLEIETVLGRYKVNPANGEQVGIKPAVAQIVKGRPEIVWPPALKTAEANLKCH
jgi:branched-chain amino acid transport system substrate-binding protein